MSGNITLYSRVVFVFLLVFASVMTFIMCSDATIANPMTTHTDNGGKHKILRSLFFPYSQHHPPAPGLPSTETGLQTGTNTEIEIGGNFREALSIIDHQSNPLQFTNSSFSYGHNTPGNRRFRAGITRMQGGYGAGGVRPTSSLFTSHSQYGGQSFERAQSRLNYHPLSQEVAQAGNSYPLIVRKSSKKEAGSPFHHSSSFSQVWEPRGVQKTYKEAKVPRNDPPKLATDKTAWPLQTAEYWSTSLPTPRGHYSGYKETNELSAVRASGIQSSKFFGFASQAASHAPSISKGLDTSVIKHNPGREKVASSITDFSQGLRSSSETLRHKNVKSYLFKDSQPSFETDNTVTSGGQKASSRLSTNKQRSSDAQVYSRFPSNSNQLHSKDPIKEDKTTPLYPHTRVAQYGGQTHSFTKYQQVIPSIYPPTQLSSHRVSGRHRTMESFIPLPNAASQDNYVTSSEKSVVGSRVNTATSGSLYGYKPGQSAKSIYGIRGFKNPLWPAVKEPSVPSSSERTNSRQYSFDKGKDYKFKIANIHSPLSPKYSFGQRGASTLTTTPAKLERTPKQYLPPSPGSLDLIQSTTVSTPRPFTSGFMDVHPPLPESDAGMDSNPHHRQLRIYKRIYGLKGFGTRPLEGAKALVSEPDKSATHQQGFEGFEPRSSQIWQLKSSRIHRRYNQTDEREPETSNISTPRQNELSSEGFKPLLKTAGSTESVESSRFSPDKYKKNRKIYTFQGFQPIRNRIANAHQKTHWKYPEQNPTTASPKHRVSSAHLRSAGGLKVESSPTSEPRTPSRTKPAAMKASLLNSSTSSTVRGKRVRGKYIKTKKLNESTSLTNDTVNVAIVRLPKLPARFKAVTYADILGSASFSSVRATTQTPITPADMDYLPNTTAVTKQREGVAYWTLNSEDGEHSRGNTSRSPEDEVEDFSSVEEKKLGFKSGGLDSGMKTFDALLDNEGSGGGGFNLSDVKSTEELSEDLSELDYLQMATGNISFKSVKLSQTEK